MKHLFIGFGAACLAILGIAATHTGPVQWSSPTEGFVLGTAAWSNSTAFDLAGAAQNATNAIQVLAANIVAFPAPVATPGPFLGTNGAGNLDVSYNALLHTNIQSTNVTFQLVQTNFVSGFVYTNFYGVPIMVSANGILTITGVAGDATLSLRITGSQGVTNQLGMQSIVSSLAVTNIGGISGFVGASGTYTFTNTSGGAGDSATVSGGQILVY